MMADGTRPAADPLETEKISRLLVRYCIPALASSLVTSVYNIVDQLFIGNTLGVRRNILCSHEEYCRCIL